MSGRPGTVAVALGAIMLALAGPGAAMAQAVVSTGVGTPFELAFWQSIDSSNDPSLYESYLTRFPNGTFGEIARAKIITLRGRMAQNPTSSPAASPALTVPVAPAAPSAATVAPVAPPTVSAALPVVPAALPGPPPPVVAVAAEPAAAAAPPSGNTLGQLLAALANSQTTGGAGAPNAASAPASAPASAVVQPVAMVSPAAPVAQHPTTAGFVLPPQPALSPVPQVALPPSFCSAEARNAFHDTVYAPSVNTARQNNEAAADYLRRLQALYDQYQLSHDPDTMNAIVGAARTYGQVAQTTFAMQAALVRQFPALMAVPVVPCAQPTQPPATTLAK
jgi:hypothetical protein